MSKPRRGLLHSGIDRRDFLLHSAAVGGALCLGVPALAAPAGQMRGEILINGLRVGREVVVRPGDNIETGKGGSISFAIGTDAFMLREFTSAMMEGSMHSPLITGLRLVSGALVAVFGAGMKKITTGFVTAAIRGTGIYVEAAAERTYFCTCYGRVELANLAGDSAKTVDTRGHSAHHILAGAPRGGAIVSAPMLRHENAELALLERLARRKAVLPSR